MQRLASPRTHAIRSGAMNRTDSRPVREPLSTTAAFRPLIIRRQCLSFLPVPRVTASLTSLEKNALLTARASGLGAGPRHSPEKGQELEGSPGHASVSWCVPGPCSRVPMCAGFVFSCFPLYMRLFVKQSACSPAQPLLSAYPDFHLLTQACLLQSLQDI